MTSPSFNAKALIVLCAIVCPASISCGQNELERREKAALADFQGAMRYAAEHKYIEAITELERLRLEYPDTQYYEKAAALIEQYRVDKSRQDKAAEQEAELVRQQVENKCKANLSRLYKAATIFAEEPGMNETMPTGTGPRVLGAFLVYGFIEDPNIAICPAGQERPASISQFRNSEDHGNVQPVELWDDYFNAKAIIGEGKNELAEDQCSYLWAAITRRRGSRTYLAMDKAPYHEGRRHVLYSDGRVELVSEERVQDAVDGLPTSARVFESREAELQEAVGSVRAAISSFYGFTALPSQEGAARYPTLLELTTPRKVVRSSSGIPRNPYSTLDGNEAVVLDAVAEGKTKGQSKNGTDAVAGWYYSATTGQFWAATESRKGW